MKSISSILFLSIVCLFFSCSDTEIDFEPMLDLDGPEIYNIRWIDYLDQGTSYTEPIVAGGEYRISIASGFQMHMEVRDKSLVEWTDAYALVNNDPNIKIIIFSNINLVPSYDLSMGYSYEPDEVSLGDGEYYKVQPGDRYHFYVSFTDEFGNLTSMYWTADLIE